MEIEPQSGILKEHSLFVRLVRQKTVLYLIIFCKDIGSIPTRNHYKECSLYVNDSHNAHNITSS